MKKYIYCFALVLSLNGIVKAQDGVLDNTFGTGGKVSISYDYVDEIKDIAIQPDGKIVAVGTTDDQTTELTNILIARFLSNGTIDNSFGTNGWITTTVVPNFNCNAFALELQSDGKIVVGAETNDTANTSPLSGKFLILRYNSNGTLDNSFASNGILSVTNTSTVDPLTFTSDLIIQPDGKIVLCGCNYSTANSTNLIFIRANTNGSLDNTFGTNGVASLATTLGSPFPMCMAIQTDNKIAFAGAIDNQTSNSPFISRLNTNGSIDPTFGSAGFVNPAYSSSSGFKDIKLDASGNIYVCGFDNNGSLIARFTNTGAADATYGNAGSIISFMGTQQTEMLNQLAIQPDGKVIAAGFADGHFAMMRTTSQGSLDAAFGTNGVVTTTFTSGIGSEAYGLELQSNGKIVLGGSNITANMNSAFEFALARYNNNSITSLNEQELSGSVAVYPNPANNLLKVDLENDPFAIVNIHDISGQLIGTYSNQQTINVSGLANGVYQLSVQSNDKIFTKKLVIAH
ncbi:MAG: T9SS type A sorting domain-containing protein [Sphingobacteriaceae bacterium]|jgi:uncharacterized delta-60 repeat protein